MFKVIAIFGFVFFGLAGDMRAQSFPSDLKPCPTGPTVVCGRYRVYEDRRRKQGRTIDLNVVVLPSVGPKRFNALFDLQGGPGVGASIDLELLIKEIPEYRQGRDIVLVDQRGTGQSNGLDCPPLAGSNALNEMYPVKYVRQCRAALEKRADLTKYTTEIAMDDLDDVRRWLGYDKVDLMGYSYGTRAAQVYLRQHPKAVGRVVLMGAIGTYHKMPFYHAANAQHAMDLLLDECASDERCNAAFPAIRRELSDLIGRLRQHPAVFTYPDPTTKTQTRYTIRADIFAEQLRKWLYSRRTSQDIPFVVHAAANADLTPYLKRVLTGGSLPVADGMYLSVTCAEDVPFINVADAHRLNEKTIFGDYRVQQQKRACSMWPRGRISRNYRQPVISTVPVMFVTGSMDPVTAPDWADELARGYKNNVMLLIPEQGHGPDGLSNIDCEDALIVKFLSGLTITDTDRACVERMRPQPFTGKLPDKH